MTHVEFTDVQHCILLQDKSVITVVIRATKGFNLQCNNVVRQKKCCSHYRTLKTEVCVHETTFLQSEKLEQLMKINLFMTFALWRRCSQAK